MADVAAVFCKLQEILSVMKRIRSTFVLLLFVSLALLSCKRQGKGALPAGTGAPWDILVVINKVDWEADHGRALFDVLNEDIYGLPQSEPFFKISRIDEPDFKGILRPVKNIILIDIASIYTKPNFQFTKDEWATGQSLLKIVAPNDTSFARYVRENRSVIQDYFVRAEFERSIEYHKKKHNRSFSKDIQEKFGCYMYVPDDMSVSKKEPGFFWASNGQSGNRMDLVVYTYPYTEKETFTADFLINKRDSVMKRFIPGGPEGSYMTTQKLIPPSFKSFTYKGVYMTELRGMWEVKGDIMGGPFVSISRLDTDQKRVITAEVFVYAPEKNKRNLLRHIEATLYSMDFNVQ